MVVNNYDKHVKFVAYTGVYPNLCSGVLTLEIDGEEVVFGYNNKSHYQPFWHSGGGITAAGDTYSGEWIIDAKYIPSKYRQYAEEINREFNDNVEHGCCGGCI